MQPSVIILGGKPIDSDITDIIYSHDYVCRVNLNLKNKKKDSKDIFFVNNHVNLNIVKKRTDPQILKDTIYNYVKYDKLLNFYNMLNNNEYSKIIEQYESGTNIKSNIILKSMNCPIRFLKAPRCGYQAILYFILNGYKVSVIGFSTEGKLNHTYYNNLKSDKNPYHNYTNELEILKWLINNNIIKYYDY